MSGRAIVLEGNCPGGQLSGGQSSGRVIVREGNCPTLSKGRDPKYTCTCVFRVRGEGLTLHQKVLDPYKLRDSADNNKILGLLCL